ncbi:glycoside hydrolase family 32 protein [Gillisia sp. Q332]|uniref:glycoside hydrolase family 32 protein n=1 Tax=Gillisia xinjiangensis TaxID=3384765 RepID=UPI00391D89D8
MKKIKIIIILSVIGMLSISSCKNNEKQESEATEIDEVSGDEIFRPNFHFTPKENWMNDPNGMFYLNGTYHLFFQYYPEGNVWGPMHWGHATSKDMVTWEELPIALEPDELGYIFSGSAVVDVDNTSGFGDGTTPPVVAIFTYHDPKGEAEGRIDYQSQAIAYSLDEGKTWTKYEANPVIANPDIKDFRDPKVIWDEQHQQWLMALATVDRNLFYGSPNLKDWELLSEFGESTGAHDGVWECPDFFPMQVENSEEIKWVLIQSLNPGGYNGGSGTQYFVGDFDGKEFKVDPSMENLPEKHDHWIDYGKDNYAGVTWSNIPESDGRKLFMGWMSNWLYAQEVPTETWRSAMTIARELSLKKVDDTYRIFSMPAEELDIYKENIFQKEKLLVSSSAEIASEAEKDLSRAELKLKIPNLKQTNYEFSLSNSEGDNLKFGYNHSEKQFYINREESGITDFNDEFAGTVSYAPRTSTSETLSVLMILDRTSIELFYDDGATLMTEIFFPKKPYTSFSVKSEGDFELKNIEINQFNFENSDTDGKN